MINDVAGARPGDKEAAVRIGIIGSGHMGRALGRLLGRAGHEVVVANSRGPQSLGDAIAEIDFRSRAATLAQAVAEADVVLLAIPYLAVDQVVREGGPWDGKVVIDLSNYYAERDGEALDPHGASTSAVVAGKLRGARVVKAFNTIWYRRLAGEPRPSGRERLVVFYAGDDPAANDTVARLIRDCGFEPVYTGSLDAGGRRQQPGTDIYNVPLTRTEAEERLRPTG